MTDRQKLRTFPYPAAVWRWIATRLCLQIWMSAHENVFQIRPVLSVLWGAENLGEFALSWVFAYNSLIYKPKRTKFETLIEKESALTTKISPKSSKEVAHAERQTMQISQCLVFLGHKPQIWTY